MNAKEMKNEIELALWELAEAETHERIAAGLRMSAFRRLNKQDAELKEAINQAKKRKQAAA